MKAEGSCSIDERESPAETERRRHRDLERLIRWYFGPVESARAMWVAWNVSTLDPHAYHRNGSKGVGLFNIDPAAVGLVGADEAYLVNPVRNVAAAHKLWCQHGWGYWDCPPLVEVFANAQDEGC
jgi:hypothetical protein